MQLLDPIAEKGTAYTYGTWLPPLLQKAGEEFVAQQQAEQQQAVQLKLAQEKQKVAKIADMNAYMPEAVVSVLDADKELLQNQKMAIAKKLGEMQTKNIDPKNLNAPEVLEIQTLTGDYRAILADAQERYKDVFGGYEKLNRNEYENPDALFQTEIAQYNEDVRKSGVIPYGKRIAPQYRQFPLSKNDLDTYYKQGGEEVVEEFVNKKTEGGDVIREKVLRTTYDANKIKAKYVYEKQANPDSRLVRATELEAERLGFIDKNGVPTPDYFAYKKSEYDRDKNSLSVTNQPRINIGGGRSGSGRSNGGTKVSDGNAIEIFPFGTGYGSGYDAKIIDSDSGFNVPSSISTTKFNGRDMVLPMYDGDGNEIKQPELKKIQGRSLSGGKVVYLPTQIKGQKLSTLIGGSGYSSQDLALKSAQDLLTNEGQDIRGAMTGSAYFIGTYTDDDGESQTILVPVSAIPKLRGIKQTKTGLGTNVEKPNEGTTNLSDGFLFEPTDEEIDFQAIEDLTKPFSAKSRFND